MMHFKEQSPLLVSAFLDWSVETEKRKKKKGGGKTSTSKSSEINAGKGLMVTK